MLAYCFLCLSYNHDQDKLRIYRSLIWPLISYGCEDWMTHSSDERLAVCERRTLRRIFELVYENDLWWRLRQNEELCELLDGLDMVKCIMFKRYNWPGFTVYFIINFFNVRNVLLCVMYQLNFTIFMHGTRISHYMTLYIAYDIIHGFL